MKQAHLFGGQRLQMTESIRLTIDSLNTYGPRHKHWAVAWSGGKDSTALLTLLIYLLDSGKVARPRTLHVFYADTRLELQPLWLVAADVRDELRERGLDVTVVMAPLDQRFLVYVLGRGVPPPNNNTMRWCTRQIKIDPMAAALEARVGRHRAARQGLPGRQRATAAGDVRRPYYASHYTRGSRGAKAVKLAQENSVPRGGIEPTLPLHISACVGPFDGRLHASILAEGRQKRPERSGVVNPATAAP